MKIVGCDPGKKGAIVILCPVTQVIHHMEEFDDMTDLEVYQLILDLPKMVQSPLTIFKEAFPSFGLDGRTSFSVGKQHGAINAACYQSGTCYYDIDPNTWVKEICGKENKDLKTKIRNLKKAQELYPEHPMFFKDKVHDGIVDALLIARYGVKSWNSAQEKVLAKG